MPPSKKRADTESFRALAWRKFNAFSLEERVAMLQQAGIPADENTVSHFYSQLIEIAINDDMELLGANWPDGPQPDLLKSS